MSKLDDKIETYTAALKKIGMRADAQLLRKVTKACGPSIYTKDGEKVSASDKKELERVKQNFMKKKLGLQDKQLDKGIEHAIDKIGRSNRNKYRAVFYYILVKKFRKEAVFA